MADPISIDELTGGAAATAPAAEALSIDDLVKRGAKGPLGPKQSYLAGLVRSAIGQGAALGWGDEGMAVLRSLVGSETYDEAVKDERAKIAAFRRENPTIAPTAEILGGFATPGLGLLAGSVRPAASIVGRMGQGAAIGSGLGAVAGAGAAEKDRLEGAASGAGIGALVGAAIPVAATVGSHALESARDMFSPTAARIRNGVDAGADEVLANKIRRATVRDHNTGLSRPATVADVQADLQAGRDATHFQHSSTTLPEVIGDTLPGFQRTLGSTYRAGGQGGNDVERFLAERQGGDPANGLFGRTTRRTPSANQYDRMNEHVERAWGIRSTDLGRERATIANEKRTLGSQEYRDAWARQEAIEQPVQDTLVAWELAAKNQPGTAEQSALQKALDIFRRKPSVTAAMDSAALNYEKMGDRLQTLLDNHTNLLSRIAGTTDAAQAARMQAQADRVLRQADQLDRAMQIHQRRMGDMNIKQGAQPFSVTDDLERFDAAKRSIDGLISEASNDNTKRLLTKMKNDLLDAVHGGDRLNPTRNVAYSEARAAWSSREELLEAAKNGAKFMRGNPGDDGLPLTRQDYTDLPAAAQRMWRLGAAEELKKMQGGKALGPNADFTRTVHQPNIYSRMREITPQGQTSDNLSEIVSRESRMSRTAAEATGNSKTAQRLQDDTEFGGRDLLGAGWRAFRQSGGVLNLGFDMLRAGFERAFGFRDDMARALAQRLIAATPAEQDAILARVAHRIGNSRMDQFLEYAQRVQPHLSAGTSNVLGQTAGIE